MGVVRKTKTDSSSSSSRSRVGSIAKPRAAVVAAPLSRPKPKVKRQRARKNKRAQSSHAEPPVAISKDTITVLVDDRAGSRDLLKIQPLADIAEKCRLSSGDACFVGNGPDGPLMVGVELKSVVDLIQSIETGRLQGTQIPAMRREYDVCWLLYYGLIKQADDGSGALLIHNGVGWTTYYSSSGRNHITYIGLTKFLFTLSAHGVYSARVANKREAASWIWALADWWAKDWSKHRGLHAFDQSRQVSLPPMGGEVKGEELEALLLRARVAAQLPGIGIERAMAVARHFDSVDVLIAATEAQWAEVPGIGKITAREVWHAVRRRRRVSR